MHKIVFIILITSCMCSCSLFIPEKYLKQIPGHNEDQQQQKEGIQSYSQKDIIGKWVLIGHREATKPVYSAHVDLKILEFTKNDDMHYSSEQSTIEKMKYKIRNDNKMIFIDKDQKEHHANLTIEQNNLILVYENTSSDKFKKITGDSASIYKQARSILNNEMIHAYGNCISGNCINGRGTYLWPTGDTYTGHWKNGKKNGSGTLICLDSSEYQKYVGEWEDDDFGGQGTLTYSDGKKFTGKWINGKKEGPGILYHANGTIKEKGKWRNDVFIGQ